MSFTTTPNYALNKPTPGADDDLWGTHLNQNADILDAQLKTIDTKASAVPTPSDSPPTMDSTAAPGISIAFSRGDHRHPTDTTRYAASNPASYVNASQAAAAAPVQSVAGHTGTVTLTHTDITDWAANVPAGSTTLPLIEGTAAIGVSTTFARSDHVHPAGGAGGAVIAPTPPTLNPGGLWWDSTGGQLYVRYDDGTSVAYVAATNVEGLANAATKAEVAAAQNNSGRNLLHNGLFNIAQRGAGGFSTSGAYSLDRWIQWTALDTLTLSQQPQPDAARTQIGDEAATVGLAVAVTGNAGATSLSIFTQRIEGVRRLGGKTVIVSFYAIGSAALKVGVSLSQIFGTGGSPSATVNVAGQSVTVATTWARYSVVLTLPSTAGKTLGTVGDFSDVVFWVSAGANSSAASGGVPVQTGSFTFWGVQLEIAAAGQTQPSPLDKPDPREDLANCQRFYQSGGTTVGGAGSSGVTLYNQMFFNTTMRAAPTMTCAYAGGTGYTGGSPSDISPRGFAAICTSNGAAYGASVNWTASADL